MQLINIIKIFAIDDGWATVNPFSIPLGTKKGFILTDSEDYDDIDFISLNNYLFKLGDLSNSLDFLEKTRSNTNYNSSGIGGFAKLKDYSFNILNISITDYIDLYGKKITVERYLDFVLYKDFEGKIQKITLVDLDELQFDCEANISLSNEVILGTSNDTTGINTVISTPMNGFIKLYKETGDIFRLVFNSWQYYQIEGIYINGQTSDEMFELKNAWQQIEKYIYIINNKCSFLQKKMKVPVNEWNTYIDNDPSSGLYDTLVMNNNAVVELTFEDNVDMQYVLNGYYVVPLVGAVNTLQYVFKPVDTLQSNVKLFEIAWYMINESTSRAYLYDMIGFNITLTIDRGVGQLNITKKVVMVKIIKEPLIAMEKRIFMNTYWDTKYKPEYVFDFYSQYLERDLLAGAGLDQNRALIGVRVLFSTEQEKLPVVQIGNEKMLVVAQTTKYPTLSSLAIDDLTSCIFYVIRGWDNTVISEHNVNDVVYLISSETQTIDINIKAPLLGFKNYPKGVGYNSKLVRDFYYNPYNVNRVLDIRLNPFLYVREKILPMIFAIPDLAGTIMTINLKGDISLLQDGTINIPGGDSSQPGMMVFLTKKAFQDAAIFEENCCLYGKDVNENSDNFNWLFSNYYTPPSNFKNMVITGLLNNDYTKLSKIGKFNFVLDGSWLISRVNVDPDYVGTRYTMYFNYTSRYTNDEDAGKVNKYVPKDLTELKESNLALRVIDWHCFLYNETMPITVPVNYEMAGMTLRVKDTFLDMNVRLDLTDNSFYAKVSSNSIILTLTDSIVLGTNADLRFLYVKEEISGRRFNSFFITCQLYDILALSFIDTVGTFTVIDSFSDANLNPLLSRFVDKGNNQYSIYSVNSSVSPHTYFVSDLTTLWGIPSLKKTVYQASNMLGNPVETTEVIVNGFIVRIELSNGIYYLRCYKKQTITNLNNPVVLIKQLMTTYLNFTDDNFDLTAFTTATNAKQLHKASLTIESDTGFNDILDKICKEHGLMLFENNIGKISIIDLNPPSSISVTLNDSDIIFNGDTPDIEISYTDLDYLISEMDVNYKYFNSKYEKTIKSADANWLKPFFDKAKIYLNGSKSKVILNLSTVTDEETAKLCSIIKMNYHFKPSRIISLNCLKTNLNYSLGTWIKIDSNSINDTDGKSYLITQAVSSESELIKYTLFEFTNSQFLNGYIETPSADIQFTEVSYEEDKQLTEIPNRLFL